MFKGSTYNGYYCRQQAEGACKIIPAHSGRGRQRKGVGEVNYIGKGGERVEGPKMCAVEVARQMSYTEQSGEILSILRTAKEVIDGINGKIEGLSQNKGGDAPNYTPNGLNEYFQVLRDTAADICNCIERINIRL
jgi:hypothetical protein